MSQSESSCTHFVNRPRGHGNVPSRCYCYHEHANGHCLPPRRIPHAPRVEQHLLPILCKDSSSVWIDFRNQDTERNTYSSLSATIPSVSTRRSLSVIIPSSTRLCVHSTRRLRPPRGRWPRALQPDLRAWTVWPCLSWTCVVLVWLFRLRVR